MVVSFGTRRPFGHEPVEPSAGVIVSRGKRNIGASSGRHKGLFQGGDSVASVPQGGGAAGKRGQRHGLFPRGVSGENQIGRPFPRSRFTRKETVCERRSE